MKQFCLLILSLSTYFTLSGQINYDVNFPDGKRIVTMEYDDAAKLPKWSLNVDIFGFIVSESTGAGPIFKINPVYRLNKQISFEASLATCYAKSLDEKWSERLGNKSYLNASAMVYCELLTTKRSFKRKTAVDFRSDNVVTHVYIVKIPRKISHAINAMGGIESYRRPGYTKLEPQQKQNGLGTDTTFYSAYRGMFSICAGLCYYKSQSYCVTASGVSRAYWRDFRIYGYLTYAVNSTLNAYQQIYDPAYSEELERSPATSGYIAPVLNPLGYKCGLSFHHGFLNTGLSSSFGIELGTIPSYQFSGFKLNNEYLSISFGLGFGQNVSKKYWRSKKTQPGL